MRRFSKHAPHRIVLAFDRVAELRIEGFFLAQQARQQEVELRPQLAQVVFQRRAGQAQAVARVSEPAVCAAFERVFLM
jgi:hypothetical protein